MWLSFLAALSRPKDAASWSIATGAGRAFARDYYPLERLLAYATAISATIAVVATIVVSSRHGGFDAALNSADEALTPMLESLAAETPLPRDVDLHKLARLLVLAAPPVVAASTLLMLMLNLWIAGRVAEVSGRLPRPWPDIPHELRLSRDLCACFSRRHRGCFRRRPPGRYQRHRRGGARHGVFASRPRGRSTICRAD